MEPTLFSRPCYSLAWVISYTPTKCFDVQAIARMALQPFSLRLWETWSFVPVFCEEGRGGFATIDQKYLMRLDSRPISFESLRHKRRTVREMHLEFCHVRSAPTTSQVPRNWIGATWYYGEWTARSLDNQCPCFELLDGSFERPIIIFQGFLSWVTPGSLLRLGLQLGRIHHACVKRTQKHRNCTREGRNHDPRDWIKISILP